MGDAVLGNVKHYMCKKITTEIHKMKILVYKLKRERLRKTKGSPCFVAVELML